MTKYNELLTELTDTYDGFDVEVRRGDKTYDFFTLNKDHKGAYSLRNDEKVEGYTIDEETRRITVNISVIKVSDVIKRLQDIMRENGDLPFCLAVFDDYEGNYAEVEDFDLQDFCADDAIDSDTLEPLGFKLVFLKVDI